MRPDDRIAAWHLLYVVCMYLFVIVVPVLIFVWQGNALPLGVRESLWRLGAGFGLVLVIEMFGLSRAAYRAGQASAADRSGDVRA